jgi:hypothetical protein
MIKSLSGMAVLLVLLAAPVALGQEYSVETIEEGPDAEELSADLVSLMSDQGMRVKRGTRTAAEIWLCKQWPIDSDFKKTMQRLYPFQSGDLIGVLHFSRRGSDFRDQQISSGWYTLRFALQPVDGNHIGTSPTRDFLVMIDVGEDAADKTWSDEELNQASAAAAGSSHPAMLCLQPPQGEGDSLSIRHDEARDWWIVRAPGMGAGADGKTQDVSLEFVIAGHALE